MKWGPSLIKSVCVWVGGGGKDIRPQLTIASSYLTALRQTVTYIL